LARALRILVPGFSSGWRLSANGIGLCPVCKLAWSGDKRVTPRSQSSLAVSADGERWLLLNASPDLRQQIIASPCLQPTWCEAAVAHPGRFCHQMHVDHLAGLLTCASSKVSRSLEAVQPWRRRAVEFLAF